MPRIVGTNGGALASAPARLRRLIKRDLAHAHGRNAHGSGNLPQGPLLAADDRESEGLNVLEAVRKVLWGDCRQENGEIAGKPKNVPPTGDKIFLSKELWRRIHLGFCQKWPGIAQIDPKKRPNSLNDDGLESNLDRARSDLMRLVKWAI